ncbi:MAG: O-antigen ligase family protein [Candidatus Limnocylindria bacterium]
MTWDLAPYRGLTRLVLVLPLIFMLLLGGTEAARLITPIRAVGALMGAAVVLWYVIHLPRRHDLVDRLALASLVVFLLACVASPTSQSFDAATTALAYVAVFYVARDMVADKRGRSWAVTVLGAVGLVVTIILLVQWVGVWLQWMSVPGAGFPPLELLLPTAQYGHHYRVAFFVGLLLPAVASLGSGTRIWHVRVLGVCAGVAVIVMSGSRTAWLAGAVSIFVGLIVSRRARLLSKRWLLPASVVVLLGGTVVVIATPLVDRLLTTSTIELRLAVWESSLTQWLQAPVAGSGPGTFHRELVLSGYYNAYDAYIPHAHNSIVQTVVETGLLGLAALALAASALVAGFARAGPKPWAPAAGIAFFVAASLGETPTQHGYLLLPLIVWAALATPRQGPEGQASVTPVLRGASVALAAVVGTAAILFFGGAFAYDRARAAAAANDDGQVLEALQTAIRLDPSSALYRRDLGVRLLSVEQYEEARTALEEAAMLNPGDQALQRAFAILALRSGDIPAATHAAEAAVRLAGRQAQNHLTQAYVALEVGDLRTGGTALMSAIRLQPWLLAAPDWVTVFPDVDKQELLGAAERSWAGDPTQSSRNARARTWLAAMTGRPLPEDASGYLLAEAALLHCDAGTAAQVLSELTNAEAARPAALQARVMTARAFGVGDLSALRELIRLSDLQLERQAFGGIAGSSVVADSNRTRSEYGRLAVVTDLDPILPTIASGLSAWLRDPVTAADLGAPGSGLAQCR